MFSLVPHKVSHASSNLSPISTPINSLVHQFVLWWHWYFGLISVPILGKSIFIHVSSGIVSQNRFVNSKVTNFARLSNIEVFTNELWWPPSTWPDRWNVCLVSLICEGQHLPILSLLVSNGIQTFQVWNVQEILRNPYFRDVPLYVACQPTTISYTFGTYVALQMVLMWLPRVFSLQETRWSFVCQTNLLPHFIKEVSKQARLTRNKNEGS